jgi:hypothetical protein
VAEKLKAEKSFFAPYLAILPEEVEVLVPAMASGV